MKPFEIIFVVERDEVDGGFVASAIGYGITTQAETEESLKRMVADAVRCHFDQEKDLPKTIRLHFVRDEVLPLVG